jgi:TonB family protein
MSSVTQGSAQSGHPGPYRLTITALLLCGIALLLAPPARAAETPTAAENPKVTDNQAVFAFREQLRLLETTQGAYGGDLSENLLGLGLALQRQGRHDDAVEVFRRGVHLARINEGLYSATQIPLVQAAISSLLATREFDEADEVQAYLYRVQSRVLERGQDLARAFIQQADWQRSAFELSIGENDGERLLRMRQLYRMAVTEIVNSEGDTSTSLLPPLYGLLRTHHLLTRFELSGGSVQTNSYSDLAAREEQGLLLAAQSQSFREGRAVIRAIYDVEMANNPENNLQAAEALVLMGDWMLWNEKRELAYEAHQEAITELAARDDAQGQMDRLLGRPVPLPDLVDARVLPREVAPEEGNILLEFTVNERGKVTDVELLESDEAVESLARRLMRKLRYTPFRPRFADNQPVTTENVTRAYALDPR